MSYVLSLLVFCGIFAILAMSLNLVLGYGGMISVAHAALMGVGAYAAALFSMHLGLNMLWGMLFGAIFTGLIGLVFAYVSFRIHGDDYVLVSFAFQMVLYEMMMQWTSLTRGSYGLNGVPRPELFGAPLSTLPSYALFVVVVAALVAVFLLYIAHSPFGLALRAVREGERAAESLGKNAQALKLTAFALASALAGLAGGLYVSMLRLAFPTDYSVGVSVVMLVYVIVGGIGNLRGSVVGVAVLIAIPQLLTFLPFIPSALQGPLQQILYGLVLMGFVWLRPQGLLPERPILSSRMPRHASGNNS